MIEEKNLTAVGKFQKTHGLKGELNAVLDIDDDFFAKGEPLIVNTDGAFVPFYAENIRGKGVSSSLIKLDGVDSQEEARSFVNSIIYVQKEHLKDYMEENGEELLLEEDLEGYDVIDLEYGKIGVIDRIDSSTDNVLFIVRTEHGEDIYIPAADDFISSIDEERKEVITTLPPELIKLNIKE